ncbi:hypothetical protein HDU99_005048 [Rhizoclosmatium hyalinum]|nr:hypothetical protein HDU99_005048 [Rhizoclosmatium hyalinum]
MNGGSSDNVGLIAGIAGGIVVALVASAVLGFILWRKKKKADAERCDAAARYAESFLPKAPAVILTPSRSIINSYTVNYPDITSRLPPPLSPALTAINDASPKLDLYNGILNYTAPVSSNDSYLLPTRNLRPVSANLSVAGNGLYNSIADLTESGASISTSTNLPQDPSTWSVTEVAVWIAQNGGRIDGAKRASMQLIDGQALMAAEDVKDIMDIVQCETYGERMRLKNALSVLKGRKKELDAPPSYSD